MTTNLRVKAGGAIWLEYQYFHRYSIRRNSSLSARYVFVCKLLIFTGHDFAGYDDACFDLARMGCSGDVAINPGPVTASTATTESIKCQICRKNVASDYRVLTCDSSNHIIGFTFDWSCSECSSISCVLALNVPHFAGICYIGSSSSKAFFDNKCETYLIKDNRLQPARALCCVSCTNCYHLNVLL